MALFRGGIRRATTGALIAVQLAFWRRACYRLGVIAAASALGLVGLSLLFPAAVASAKEPAVAASPSPTPSGSLGNLGRLLPQLVKPLALASTPATKTVDASYACDFSGYGAGITASTMSAEFVYASSWPVNQPMGAGFAIDAVALPSQVSSALAGVDSMTISAAVTAGNASEATIQLSGPTTQTLPNPPTTIPATAVVGQVTFPKKGTGTLELPAPTIVVTPMEGNAAQPAITCTTSTAAQAKSITVGDASGEFDHCVTTIGSGASAVKGTSSGLDDIKLSESGTEQAGKTVTVKLTSDDIGGLISSLAAEVSQQTGDQLTKATFTAALALTGAQAGTMHPSATDTDMTATSFSASEALKLSKAGTTNVDIPATWRLDLFVNTTQVIDIACTLVTKPAPVGLTLHVAQASPTSSPSGAATTAGGAPEGSGTPVGAPNTGGGLAPGANVPLVAGGLAVLLIGGGLVTRGVSRGRRRR